MGGIVRYSEIVDQTGDQVVSCADRIDVIGDHMYGQLRSLIDSGQLSGPGISEALEASHQRWNTACKKFSAAEQRLGVLTKQSYTDMMTTDLHAANYFST